MPARRHIRSTPHILELLSSPDRGQSHVQFVTPRGVRETDFADLWSMSSRAAQGIKTTLPAGRVAGILTPSAEMIGCAIGSLRAGRDFVSLPLPGRGQDASGYAQQVRAIAESSNACALVVEAAYADLLQSLPGVLPCRVIVAEHIAEATTSILHSDEEPGELIQFSSGTTGTPKGVRLTGEAIGASVESTLDILGVDDAPETFCAWVPLSHDMGLIGGLLGSWAGCRRTRPGYKYICISPELFLSRPLIWMETSAARQATVTAAPAFAYHVLSRHLSRSRQLDLTRLRACVVGAEPVRPDTLRAFAAAASAHGLNERALCPAYGLAEAVLGVSLVPPHEPWTTQTVSVDGKNDTYVSCGRLLDCVKVEAPDIVAGAGPIRVAGPVVSSAFLPPRDSPTDGWLDTGDLGVLAEGELFVTGRSDDLICIAGRHLFAWELESAARALPQVRAGDCAVVTDGRGGYLALFEPRDADAAVLDDAPSALRRKLTAVAGVGPSAVGCVPRGTLPKTPSGKIRRNLIAADRDRLIDCCIVYKEF